MSNYSWLDTTLEAFPQTHLTCFSTPHRSIVITFGTKSDGKTFLQSVCKCPKISLQKTGSENESYLILGNPKIQILK
jgi:hypothetical protein